MQGKFGQPKIFCNIFIVSVSTNRNFDKIFVFVFVFNTKEVPGVRKVFICFEISKIFLNLPKKFDNLTVIKSGNSLVLEKKLCKVSWNHLKCKPEWMLVTFNELLNEWYSFLVGHSIVFCSHLIFQTIILRNVVHTFVFRPCQLYHRLNSNYGQIACSCCSTVLPGWPE